MSGGARKGLTDYTSIIFSVAIQTGSTVTRMDLVIFLTPEDHNMSEKGIHANKEFDLYAKRKAQLRWMEFYGKTEEQFRKRYGKSWL